MTNFNKKEIKYNKKMDSEKQFSTMSIQQVKSLIGGITIFFASAFFGAAFIKIVGDHFASRLVGFEQGNMRRFSSILTLEWAMAHMTYLINRNERCRLYCLLVFALMVSMAHLTYFLYLAEFFEIPWLVYDISALCNGIWINLCVICFLFTAYNLCLEIASYFGIGKRLIRRMFARRAIKLFSTEHHLQIRQACSEASENSNRTSKPNEIEPQGSNVVKQVNRLEADAVFLIGDIVDAPRALIEKRVESLRHLQSRLGTFYVTGNHEYYYGDVKEWFALFESYGIRVLKNEAVILNGHCVVGLNDIFSDNSGIRNHVMDVKAISICPLNETTIVLAHNPAAVKRILEFSRTTSHPVDLILSGHTHSAQYLVLVPFAYFVLPYLYGLYSLADGATQLLVSAGTLFQNAPMKIPFIVMRTESMLAEPKRKQRISIDPQNLNWRNDANSFGKRMLERMGWRDGCGLGKNGEGINANVRPSANHSQTGLGFGGKASESEWMSHNDAFSHLLTQLNDKKLASERVEGTEQLNSAGLEEETRQHSVVNVHRKGRLTALSPEQKFAIFGRTTETAIKNKKLHNFEKRAKTSKEKTAAGEMVACQQKSSSSSSVTMDVYFAGKGALLSRKDSANRKVMGEGSPSSHEEVDYVGDQKRTRHKAKKKRRIWKRTGIGLTERAHCQSIHFLSFEIRPSHRFSQNEWFPMMGQNLILNMNDHGFVVCAYNRTVQKVTEFLENEAKATKIVGAKSMEEMVRLLKKPRRVMLLVKAGKAVQDMIDKLVPLLEEGDVIIDGGNSEYHDSNLRCRELASKGILFVGCGVSGGEEGARLGASLMPGGSPAAWPHLKPIFQAIAAKAPDGEPCCDWVGEAGSGHFVKMVHNGIEYGDMQLISEAFHLMHQGLQMDFDAMSNVFDEWNKGELDSFLIEITANILRYKDETGESLVPKILDSAQQKGTGKWTGIAALEYGIPVTLIAEAVFARCLSALKTQRMKASKVLPKPSKKASDLVKDTKEFLNSIGRALYASKVVSYAQGFMLLAEASREFGWNLDYGAIALMWRGGCIIRSRFLGRIKSAFEKNPSLVNLLLDDFFLGAIQNAQDSWREVISTAVQLGIPMPAFSCALAFFDGYRTEILPANLLQAQRDYFGAHTYELLDQPGVAVHTNWTGKGGRVTSNAYSA
uniref:6-phosphogluconate dehydrogenase, decarboxylating n=1 Tax=Globodera rostochiensis TaxID=31243 RepID=A0A914GRD7_GLORO